MDVDPITALFNRDWASIGGWGLFLSLTIFLIVGVFRGWWVPGWMYRKQAETLKEAMEQNRVLLTAAEITKHFFEATAPHKGDSHHDVE